MNKKNLIWATISVLLVLTVVFIVIGQNNANSPDKKVLLVDRFENVIKGKEPRFNGGRKKVGGEKRQDFSMLGWRLHEDYVYVDVSDYYNTDDALTVMKNYLSDIRPVNQPKTKLTNLGDEAYLEISKNSAYIKLRKGNVVLRISSTKPTIAKRFARYFVNEIEKRDRGEP